MTHHLATAHLTLVLAELGGQRRRDVSELVHLVGNVLPDLGIGQCRSILIAKYSTVGVRSVT